MLVGHALRIGEKYGGQPLVYPILHKSLAFLGLLLLLNVIEEAVVGVVHGHPVAESLSRIAGGTWLQIFATCILFFMILLPYFAYREIGRLLGEGSLRRMLFTPAPGAATAAE